MKLGEEGEGRGEGSGEGRGEGSGEERGEGEEGGGIYVKGSKGCVQA